MLGMFHSQIMWKKKNQIERVSWCLTEAQGQRLCPYNWCQIGWRETKSEEERSERERGREQLEGVRKNERERERERERMKKVETESVSLREREREREALQYVVSKMQKRDQNKVQNFYKRKCFALFVCW